jgi:hypothetical protein
LAFVLTGEMQRELSHFSYPFIAFCHFCDPCVLISCHLLHWPLLRVLNIYHIITHSHHILGFPLSAYVQCQFLFHLSS